MPGSVGIKLRYIFYKPLFFKCGNNININVGVVFNNIDQISLGSNIRIDEYCIFNVGEVNKNRIFSSNKFNLNNKVNSKVKLLIGDYVHFNQYCLISSFNLLKIHNYCTFSSGVKVYNVSHHFRNNKIRNQVTVANNLNKDKSNLNSLIITNIELCENVFISINAIILNGKIGKNSFVYPNSIVSSDIKENSLYKKDRVIGKRFK